MFTREKHVPFYVQIKKDLEKLIGGMRADERIPSENELTEIYNVSRATIKQALMELVHEERLYRVQGKGTFVSHTKIKRSFDILPTFTDEIRRSGIEPRSEVIFFGPVCDKPEANAALGIEAGRPVLCYSRVVTANGLPMSVAHSYVDPDTYPGLSVDMIRNSLYKALRKHYNKVPVRMTESYSAVPAPKSVAKLLKMDDQSAVFFCVRVAFLQAGTPVEYVESFIRGDQYFIEISTEQGATAQSVEHHALQNGVY